jgi:glycosyltransferase involved in cell wall biosynthesis
LLGRLDVFHSCDPFVPPMKKCLGIVTVHDLSQKKFPRFFERRVLRWDRYLRDSLQRAAAVVVPSNSTKNDLLEMFNVTEEKVHVVPTPVNASFRREPILGFDGHVGEKFRLESPFALSVGTLEPRKNILSVVRAFELVHRAHNTPLRLVLVGKRGWMYQEIFEAIRASPVGGLVRYLGYISDDELASVYRQAQVFVYPSFYEGYGFPVLEAMVSGTPVVTSRNSSLEEIAQGAAFLIDPRSTEELANAMYTLSEDSSRRSELIFAGLQRARQCSPQIASARILRIYESLNLL